MSMPHQDFPENSLKFKKYLGYPQEKNERSFWAFLLSLFIYISIFYIFNLSPSYVLNTTKFWFFVSVTLILIIAADFDAFSSSNNQKDCYDEYVKIRGKYNRVTSGSHHQETVNTSIPIVKVDSLEEIREEIKKVVDDCERKSPKNNSQYILNYGPENARKEFRVDNDFEKSSEMKNKAKCVRTMSNLSSSVVKIENNIVLRKTESGKYDAEEKNEREESDFSTMSNEELNRRVEDFIQRFNRQIRLQAAQDRKQFYGIRKE